MEPAICRKGRKTMKIAVLGGGAMGSLFGGYLSRQNDVLIVDVNEALVRKINDTGLKITEPDGSSALYHPRAATVTAGEAPADLVIVFVKAMFTRSALAANRALIGSSTRVMTLQNGSGHEQTLREFVDEERIIIGTTQHNSAVTGLAEIRHGGAGMTHLGRVRGEAGELAALAEAFSACGLETDCSSNVKALIWDKMFTNVSASVLTGVLQTPLRGILASGAAWSICEQLVREAVAVAAGEGLHFDAEEKVREVRAVCERSPEGITSICADLAKGRRTEVDTISGSVVAAARRNGVPAPTHELMVSLVHAMEELQARERGKGAPSC